MHEITENDLIDMTVLVAEHDFRSNNPERIDLDRIIAPLATDWGFFHTPPS